MPKQSEHFERLARLVVWFVPALWAVNYIVARKAPGVVEPYTLALGRWLLAGVVLTVLARRELWAHRHAIARVWKGI